MKIIGARPHTAAVRGTERKDNLYPDLLYYVFQCRIGRREADVLKKCICTALTAVHIFVSVDIFSKKQ